MDRGAWWAIYSPQGCKSQTWLSDYTTTTTRMVQRRTLHLHNPRLYIQPVLCKTSRSCRVTRVKMFYTISKGNLSSYFGITCSSNKIRHHNCYDFSGPWLEYCPTIYSYGLNVSVPPKLIRWNLNPQK